MKITFAFILSLALPGLVLALCATVVTSQILASALPGALDAWGRICLGLFFGALFGTWIVTARLARIE